MGCIISAQDALERLRFVNLTKGRVHKAESIVVLQRTDGGTGPDVALVKMANGDWTVLGSRHSPNGNWAVMGYGLTKFDKGVLDALVKVGAITREDMDRHIANAEGYRAARERRHAIESLTRACAELGIEVPAIPEDAALVDAVQRRGK